MAEPAAVLGPQSYPFSLVARRTPGVSESQATDEMATLGARAANAFPNPMGKLAWQVAAFSLDNVRLDPSVRRSLLVLFGAVWLVLGIACVNVANLLLGRASARRREIAVRMAIGAGHGRLVRLFLVESLLLALLGAVASIAVAWVGVHALGTIDPSAVLFGSSRETQTVGAAVFSSIALDGRALAFTLATSLVVGVLFGLAPVLGAMRASLTDDLKNVRRSAVAGIGRRTLVVAEVALALVLLVASGLMVRSLANLLSVNVGFDGTNVLTFRLTLPPGSVARESIPGLYSQILDRVRAVPGVTDAALDSCAPMIRACVMTPLLRRDAPRLGNIYAQLTGIEQVTPNWFSLMRVRLLRGRPFSAGDGPSTQKVVLLNESAAKTFFGTQDPIGKRVSLGMGGVIDAEVIGIVAGVRQLPDSSPGLTTYALEAQSPPSRVIVFVRTSRDAASAGNEVRRAVHDVAPQLPVYDMQTMTQRAATATAEERFRTTLLTAFAIAALALAAIGVYGVLSFAVTARTREIGIRIALGAERAKVQRLVIGEGVGLVGVGIALGLAGAVAATRVLRTFLFDLTPADPITYIGIVIVLVITAALASWIPGRRAARVDPVIALRAE
jgi:predicted permease